MHACNTKVGYCFSQEQPEGDLRQVGYWSPFWSKSERKYFRTEREFLAIFCAISHLRPYPERTRCTQRTKHHSLRWGPTLTYASGQLTSRRLRVMENDFDVRHRARVKTRAGETLA